MQAELEAAQARVAELEAELARRPQDEWRLAREAVERAHAAKADAKRAARAEVAEGVAKLKAENARLKSDPDNAAAERIKSLERQLKGERTKNNNMRNDLWRMRHFQSEHPLVLTKAELRTLRRGVQPDAKHNEHWLTEAAALVKSLISDKKIVEAGL